jgi:hypothetical protein
MTPACGTPAEYLGRDRCTGRGDDITRVLLERISRCDVAAEERRGGEYAVTLPSWARASQLGIGTSSLVPEWYLSARLGSRCRSAMPSDGHPTPFAGRERRSRSGFRPARLTSRGLPAPGNGGRPGPQRALLAYWLGTSRGKLY